MAVLEELGLQIANPCIEERAENVIYLQKLENYNCDYVKTKIKQNET
jgi:hypothetical protein